MPTLAALILVAGNATAGVTLGVSAPSDAIPTLDNSYGVLELAYNLGKAAPAGNITQNGIAFAGKSHANGAVAPV